MNITHVNLQEEYAKTEIAKLLNLLDEGKVSEDDEPATLLKIVKDETQAILHDDSIIGNL